jgi:uncharacterized protein (DUF58 family)
VWLSRSWLPVCLFLVFLAVVFDSGPLIGLAAFLIIAGYLARYWSRHVLDDVRYERLIPENRAFAGEDVTLTLRLSNDKPLPVPWIEVRDAIPEGIPIEEKHAAATPYPGYVYLARSTHLSWYQRVNWPMQFEAPPRGYYRLGPARISSGDIFGFYPVLREDENFDSVIIYPAIYDLPDLGLPSKRPFGERKGYERIFEDPGRIAGLRDYQPGDPMRRIDWKASARSGVLQSRVYEPSSTLHMLIALNVNTLAHSWEGFLPDVLERVISAAGSVARYGFEAGYAIGLAANGSYPESDRPMRVPVGRRSDQLMRVLEALAVIGPLTTTSIDRVIDREAQSFPYGATMVCVTSRMDAPLAASLQSVAAAGHAVTVLSLADGELEGLDGIRVYNLSNTMKSLETRRATVIGGIRS